MKQLFVVAYSIATITVSLLFNVREVSSDKVRLLDQCPTFNSKNAFDILFNDCDGERCFRKQKNFDGYCRDKVNGTAVNNRCFFVPNEVGNWWHSWTICLKQDSQFANVHTKAEEEAIFAYMKTTNKDGIWLSLKNYHIPGQHGGPIHYRTTRWHDNQATDNLALSVGNTFIRSHQRIEHDSGEIEKCIVFQSENNKKDLYLHDNDCINRKLVLCHIRNNYQKYIRACGCVTEGIIKEIPFSTPESCVRQCHVNSYHCRGFNYDYESRLCQLTTWDIDDEPTVKYTRSCAYYKFDSS